MVIKQSNEARQWILLTWQPTDVCEFVPTTETYNQQKMHKIYANSQLLKSAQYQSYKPGWQAPWHYKWIIYSMNLTKKQIRSVFSSVITMCPSYCIFQHTPYSFDKNLSRLSHPRSTYHKIVQGIALSGGSNKHIIIIIRIGLLTQDCHLDNYLQPKPSTSEYAGMMVSH